MVLPPMERRLQERYRVLVKSHLHSVPRTAAGPALRFGRTPGFAATQAAWRFLNNPHVSLAALVNPLRETGRQALGMSRANVALLVHDWCKLDYRRHTSKQDLVQLTHETDVGYELTTALLVDAEKGSPLAPMEMHLKTSQAVHSTRDPAPSREEHHLEQILPTMEAAACWNLPGRLIHVMDREADSVGHFRQWDEAGHWFLVRADDRRVSWRGQSILLSDLAAHLEAEGLFREVREISFRGRPAWQRVAETRIVLDRPAKTRLDGRQREVPGRALPLRLVIAQACDRAGKVQAQWLLLTNAAADSVSDEQVALYYYWRWQIESFFKLLKSSGQEIEHWQQTTGAALARRLLVAAMACVVVWGLQRSETAPAREAKDLLIRLSGRQMKRKRPHTAPALLAGLFVLLSALELLEEYDGALPQLRHLAAVAIPLWNTG